MPTTIRRNDWIYDYELNSSTKRKKPQKLKATNLTHYRYIHSGIERKLTVQKTVLQSANPNTSSMPAISDCINAYPASLVSNRLLAKIKSQTWSAVVDLAELPETLRFLADSVRAMYRIYRDLKRGRPFKSVKVSLDEAASFWMAWRYAVMPIVYSIQSAVKWAQEPEEVIGRPLIARTHVTVDHVSKPSSDQTLQWHLSGKLRGVVAYQVTGKRTAMKLGFSLAELPAVLWEVTPLSFVVDWILPIGDALSGLSATNNVEFLDGYTSLRFKGSCSWPDTTVYGFGDEPIIEMKAAAAERSMIDYYNRKVLTGFPTPSIHLDPNMNLKRWIDALALIKLIVLRGMK